MLPVVLVIVVAAVALFVIEFTYIYRREPTISERMQRLNASLGGQLFAGLFFLLGCLAGWFVCHFASPPPIGGGR